MCGQHFEIQGQIGLGDVAGSGNSPFTLGRSDLTSRSNIMLANPNFRVQVSRTGTL